MLTQPEPGVTPGVTVTDRCQGSSSSASSNIPSLLGNGTSFGRRRESEETENNSPGGAWSFGARSVSTHRHSMTALS